MSLSYLKLHFDKAGKLVSQAEKEAILNVLLDPAQNVSDLWIFSHGWKNDEERADATYNNWVVRLDEQLQRHLGPAPQENRPLVVGLYWPSLAWAKPLTLESTPPSTPTSVLPTSTEEDMLEAEFGEGGYSGAEPLYNAGFELELADDPSPESPANAEKDSFLEEYRPVFGSNHPSFEADFSHLYSLLFETPALDYEQSREFLRLLKRYEEAIPQPDLSLEKSLLGPLKTEILAKELSSMTEASGLGLDPLEFFRVFTFWMMKDRAGLVGENGVAPFLQEVKLARSQRPLKIHLLGHSFGAKLVSATVYRLGQFSDVTAPVVDTLVLLLGAFSQFSFSANIPVPGGGQGRYSSVVANRLVRNAIAAIYSRYDRANREIYPLGMSLASEAKKYELGSELELLVPGGPDDKHGSIGANGAQGLAVQQARLIELKPLEESYNWKEYEGLACLNVDGHQFINANKEDFFAGSHGDTNRPEIFHLALSLSRQ